LPPYNRDIILPSALNYPVELNVPIPADDVGVSVAFHIIFSPAAIVGVLVLAARLFHVLPSSKE